MILTAANDSMCVEVPGSAYTLDGFREWVYSDTFPEQGRVTYFRHGVFLDMAAEKANSHGQVKSEITRVLANLVAELDLGQIYGDGLWVTNDDAELSNVADATFISWESLETGRIVLIKSPDDEDGVEFRGSPDWVLEVVSTSSVRKDTIWLPEAYHKAGVREYWLVDARGETIDFTIHAWRPDGFEIVHPENGWRKSELFDREVRLERSRDRVGGWRYLLSLRC